MNFLLLVAGISLAAAHGEATSADITCSVRHIKGKWLLDSPRDKNLKPGDLVIESRMPEEHMGTMHFAERSLICYGNLKPIVFGDDKAANEEIGHANAPIFWEEHFRLNDELYLLQSMTSYGSPYETRTLFLVKKTADGLVIADELDFSGYRAEMMSFVRSKPSVAVGILLPMPRKPREDVSSLVEIWRIGNHKIDLSPQTLHARDFFMLQSGACNFAAFPPVSPVKNVELFGRRVVWFDVVGDKFVLLHRKNES